jgi:purine-binding chemotaxis protein CheW
VIRAVDWTPVPGAPDGVLGVIDIGGEILPLLSVRKRFGFPPRDVGLDDAFIIARTSARSVALVVDEIVGVVERPTDQIVPPQQVLPNPQRIDGAFRLEDGLTLVHDLDRFLSLEEEAALERALTE